MVRFCVVEGCKESDLTTLTHRFPKNVDRWRESLNLSETDLRNKVVCCRHFRECDYANKLSNFLNRTAVPHVFVAEDERRNNRVEHPERMPLPEVQSSAALNPDNQMEIFIELEDSGEQIAFQTTKTVPLMVEDIHQWQPRVKRRRERLEDPSDGRLNVQEDPIELQSPAAAQETADTSVTHKDVVVRDPGKEISPDEVEKQLRDHYSKYTKAELIDFLVKLRVFLK